SGVAALLLAAFLFYRVKSQPTGNARMNEIAGFIREGSMAFLGREFKILAAYSVCVFVVLYFTMGLPTAASFLFGAVLSLLAGFAGMKAATLANVRTAEAARNKGRGDALMV